jgi:hypothetical protein
MQRGMTLSLICHLARIVVFAEPSVGRVIVGCFSNVTVFDIDKGGLMDD